MNIPNDPNPRRSLREKTTIINNGEVIPDCYKGMEPCYDYDGDDEDNDGRVRYINKGKRKTNKRKRKTNKRKHTQMRNSSLTKSNKNKNKNNKKNSHHIRCDICFEKYNDDFIAVSNIYIYVCVCMCACVYECMLYFLF